MALCLLSTAASVLSAPHAQPACLVCDLLQVCASSSATPSGRPQPLITPCTALTRRQRVPATAAPALPSPRPAGVSHTYSRLHRGEFHHRAPCLPTGHQQIEHVAILLRQRTKEKLITDSQVHLWNERRENTCSHKHEA